MSQKSDSIIEAVLTWAERQKQKGEGPVEKVPNTKTGDINGKQNTTI